MFVALRQLGFARGRTVTLGLVVGLVAVLVVVVTGFTNGLTSDTISAIRRLPASHLVFSADASSSQFARSRVDQRMVDGWRARVGDDAAVFGTTITRGRSQTGVDVEMALFGMEAGSFIAPDVTEGRPLAEGPGVVISRQIADVGVAVGDVLRIDRLGLELPVVGVTGRSSFGHVAAVYSSLRTWQRVQFGLPGDTSPPAAAFEQATGIALRHAPSDAGDLDRRLGTTTMTRTAALSGAPGYDGETMIMNTIRIFLYVISALIVGAFFVVLANQRRGEVALLKAIGASPSYVVRNLVGEIACLLVPAVAVGCLVGWAVGIVLHRSVPFEQTPASTLTAGVLLVTTGLGSVVVTARRTASVEPLLVLGANR